MINELTTINSESISFRLFFWVFSVCCYIRLLVFFHWMLNYSHLSSKISRNSKKLRQEEKPRNSKEQSVSHSGHFIPDEYTPADHCT